MKYKHVIFDIDGTLLDSAYADLTALQRVLFELQNINYQISDLYSALGIPGEAALKQLGVKEVTVANRLWSRYMKELSSTMKLFDGIAGLLAELKRRDVKLGIITSKNRQEFNHDFTPFGLDPFFDTVITVEDSPMPKPSAEPMLAYLKKTGANRQEVIYVGDTLYDRDCAQQASVDFGLAMWGCHSTQHISSTYSFANPEDLLSLISQK